MSYLRDSSALLHLPTNALWNALSNAGVVVRLDASHEFLCHLVSTLPDIAQLSIHISAAKHNPSIVFRDGERVQDEFGTLSLPFLSYLITRLTDGLPTSKFTDTVDFYALLSILPDKTTSPLRNLARSQRLNTAHPLLQTGLDAATLVLKVGWNTLRQSLRALRPLPPSLSQSIADTTLFLCLLPVCDIGALDPSHLRSASLYDGSLAITTIESLPMTELRGILSALNVAIPEHVTHPSHLTSIVLASSVDVQMTLRVKAVASVDGALIFRDGVLVETEFGTISNAFMQYILEHTTSITHIPKLSTTREYHAFLCLLQATSINPFRTFSTSFQLNTPRPILQDGRDALDFLTAFGFPLFKYAVREVRQLPQSLRATSLDVARFSCLLSPTQLKSIEAGSLTVEEPLYRKRRRLMDHELPTSSFITVPSPNDLHDAQVKYLDATDGSALSLAVCVVCAQETFSTETVSMAPSRIPNIALLKPSRPHPSHTLFQNQYLLYNVTDNAESVSVCHHCKKVLSKDSLPPLALANDMWIGDVPPELAILSLCERLLVARYLPVAYVIKLFPKFRGAHTLPDKQVMKGLKGNVSTYPLPTSAIAGFLDGTDNRLPLPPSALTSVISVTFIKPNKKVQYPYPSSLLVSRRRVAAALKWLISNNALYHNMVISDERLAMLPLESAIPQQIIDATRQSTDMESLDRERDTYIPEDGDFQSSDEGTGDYVGPNILLEKDDNAQPDVPTTHADIPLLAHGLIDINGNEVVDEDLQSHAIANASDFFSRYRDDVLSVRRSSAFVNEYARVDADGQRSDGGPGNPNHLLGSFPCLFPYGLGGFETARRVDVPYETHAQWALRHADRRFRLDTHFIFQVFGVIHKRKICRHTALQVKTSYFKDNTILLSSLTPADFRSAEQEENRGVKFTDNKVQALRRNLTLVRARVEGTDENRTSIRSRIWSTNVVYNPPSLWITINPEDHHDPIAQLFAGADIDISKFPEGPDATERTTNIVADPYASATFFHTIIRAVLQHLFGIHVNPHNKKKRITRNIGIFGKINAYIGTVEAQGRGTLHLHLLLWLDGTLSPSELYEKLKEPAFRQSVQNYISATITADIGGMEAKEILAIPKLSHPSYSCPLDPRNVTNSTAPIVAGLARTLQVHSCSPSSCLIYVKGRQVCKHRLPFSVSDAAKVDETGSWLPKRLYAYVNNYNTIILSLLRCNHDVKLILQSPEAAQIVWYITTYATKKQMKSSNSSAILGSTLAFHRRREALSADTVRAQKLLLIRCCNALGSMQEFSAQEVVSYLMGYGDRYISHVYSPIYVSGLVGAIKGAFPAFADGTLQKSPDPV